MTASMIEKILAAKSGETVKVKPNYILINDGPSYKALDLVEDSDMLADNLLIFIDYDVPAAKTSSSEIFKKLVKFSKKRDVDFIQAKGIRYQVLLDEYVKPGDIVVSCGKHNSIFGAVGALGLNAGIEIMGKEILKKGEYLIEVPKTTAVELTGKLGSDFIILDLVLEYLNKTQDMNLKNEAIEFIGEVVKNLTKTQKAVLCSRAAETGAVTAFINEEYNAEYEGYSQKIKININELNSYLQLPSSKNELQIADIKNMNLEFDSGFIGGYTGGHLEDLKRASEIINGKKIARGFRLSICPVTSAVFLQAMEEGILHKFIDFGAQIIVSGDRNIIDQGPGVIGAGEKLLTTGVYNFPGSQGSEDGEVYIGSVDLVAKASISKTLV